MKFAFVVAMIGGLGLGACEQNLTVREFKLLELGKQDYSIIETTYFKSGVLYPFKAYSNKRVLTRTYTAGSKLVQVEDDYYLSGHNRREVGPASIVFRKDDSDFDELWEKTEYFFYPEQQKRTTVVTDLDIQMYNLNERK